MPDSVPWGCAREDATKVVAKHEHWGRCSHLRGSIKYCPYMILSMKPTAARFDSLSNKGSAPSWTISIHGQNFVDNIMHGQNFAFTLFEPSEKLICAFHCDGCVGADTPADMHYQCCAFLCLFVVSLLNIHYMSVVIRWRSLQGLDSGAILLCNYL